MATLITPAELAAWPGFADIDMAGADAVCDAASALVLLIGDPDWTAETVHPAAKPVLVAMCRRALVNPLGRSAEQLGDFMWQASGGTRGILATREETRIIRQAAGKSGAGSVALSSPLPLCYWRT